MSKTSATSSFNELVANHGPGLYRLCKAYLGLSEEVNDLYQEVLINVWKALPGFRGEAQLSTWLYRISVNTAITYRRKQAGYEARMASNELEHLADDESDRMEKLQTESNINQLMACIDRLESDQRIVMGLYLEDLSYKEIAEVIGKDTNYVGVKLMRIKEKLAKMMIS